MLTHVRIVAAAVAMFAAVGAAGANGRNGGGGSNGSNRMGASLVGRLSPGDTAPRPAPRTTSHGATLASAVRKEPTNASKPVAKNRH